MKQVVFGLAGLVVASLPLIGCGPSEEMRPLKIDGSSTVYPIAEAVAEEFDATYTDVKTTIGRSGSGGGFKRFVLGQTDISNASRPIKKSELELAKKNNIEFVEVPIAYDGLSIVVNKQNSFVDQLTVADLKRIFEDGSSVNSWSDVREGWPEIPLKIYMPGADSGTFDYFKEVVIGDKGSVRSDQQASEDDNVLVNGVAGDEGGLGFFGCSYYFENSNKIRAVPIVNEDSSKAVLPSKASIESGEYAPFSRPLFIYVNKSSLENKKQVRDFVDYLLSKGGPLIEEVGYVQLPSVVQERARANVTNLKLGTQYLDASSKKRHGAVTDIYL